MLIYISDEGDHSDFEDSQPSGGRKPASQALQTTDRNSSGGDQNAAVAQQLKQLQQLQAQMQAQLQSQQQQAPAPAQAAPQMAGGRIAPIRQSRILDRPAKEGEKDSSLKM